MRTSLFIIILLFLHQGFCSGQSRFFRQYWMEYNSSINNTNSTGRPERPRVGDRRMSTDPSNWSRQEAQVNGLIMINIPDTIHNIDHAELYLELWGGHPGTAGKRFQINGGQVYPIPDKPTSEHHCEYIYPVIPFDFRELVRGNNAIQFGCDRGATFWGHYIIDQLAVRCYLKVDNSLLVRTGLDKFRAVPSLKSKTISDIADISLDYPVNFKDQITAVHYLAKYSGYDEIGSGEYNGWHGYTHDRILKGHLGTSDTAPFSITWNTSMIPDQSGPIAIRALIEFKNGLFCWSETLDGLTFPLNRKQVSLYYCSFLPKPFWSRAGQLKTASFHLKDDISKIESAELHIRIWDGGEGEVKEPFKLNGVPYSITSGKAVHDLVYKIIRIDKRILKQGLNEMQLFSDTEHHGIEVCWPGPALIVKYKSAL